ncbi:MAG: SpoIID/LytB domain-containing protein [Candidatus Omnitrophota bacterium]
MAGRPNGVKRSILAVTALALIFLVNFLSCANTADSETLRVRVARDADKTSLTVKGPYTLYALGSDKIIKKGNDLDVILGEWGVDSPGLKVSPAKSGAVYLGKRRFRGDLDIVKHGDGSIVVINHVSLDDYLNGVMRNEVSELWPMEALKAQAIAARTYALYQRSVRKERDFDVTSDVYSQVYGGIASERWRTGWAIRQTRSMVLTYGAKVLPAYYHAACGGHTEDASILWNIDLAPLKGQRSVFCKASPHYNWSRDIKVSEIEASLQRAGYKIGNLRYMILTERDASDRIMTIKLVGDQELEVPAGDFRLALGPNIIKSTNFDIIDKGGYFRFRGKGWGHGVGMCQWCAYFLSKKGYRAHDILRFYYPGTEIVRSQGSGVRRSK